MCDCFHLAFPNWHGPATGAGRRLRGPEQDTEDDSVCEEPEILEGERPRPQGSSPVEEFPAEKTVEEDLNRSPHKSSSHKRSRKVGFGSLFDKRSPAKMSESEVVDIQSIHFRGFSEEKAAIKEPHLLFQDTQSGESGVIVKTVKEACADGLVVTGGGKEGIFIKEVKPDSPAAKHLTVKEGDQILSATVYFDNVSYEDALQILEHAQPYKLEFRVKRKKESAVPEAAESIQPDGNEGSPRMRTPRKKKQQDRISWPKFPSFGKGHKAQFKRSHSTSEAEEHKKLEMSPTTSDTESPIKSPLKSPDGRGKKKKQKIKLKMKMKGHRSKSVEETQRNEKQLISEDLIILEDQQVGDEKPATKLVEMPQDMDEPEYKDSSKIADDHAFPSLSGMQQQHEAHLISLGNTLKTTDISDALAEGSANVTRPSDEGKTERSELKISIGQEEKPKTAVDGQLINVAGIGGTIDPSAYNSVAVSPVVISQADVDTSQLDTDINTEVISKDSSEKKLKSESTETSKFKLDASVDLLDIGELKQSPKTDGEKQWKENILEKESYGIRTRGPLADIATSKTPFASAVDRLQFITPDSSEIWKESNMPKTITVISQPLPKASFSAVDATDSHLEIKPSRLPTGTKSDDILPGQDKSSKFKLPRVDESGFVIQESMTKMELSQTHLPKREDIVIPGMEDTRTKSSLKTSGMKVPKVEKIINITKEREIQEEFNVEDVKEAVSKFPVLKLPERDITGVLVQREITIMEMKSDKTNMTPRGSPRKISCSSADSSSTVTKIKLGKEESSSSTTIDKDIVRKIPKVDLPYVDEETITASEIDYTKPERKNQQTTPDTLITDDGEITDVKFKLPKREDIEIPGMEAIKDSSMPSDNKMKYSNQQEKKSKKQKKSMPTIGITKPDIRIPDIGIELPKKDVPPKKDIRDIKETLEAGVLCADSKFPENINLKRSPKSKAKVEPKDVDIMICQQVEEGKLGVSERLKTDIEYHKPMDGITTESSDIKTDVKGRKFKLPKFDISFPEVKAPKIYASKKEVDIPKPELPGKDQTMSEVKANLPEGKTGVHPSPLDDQKISLQDAELKLSDRPPSEQGVLQAEPPSADINVSDEDKDVKHLSEDMKAEGHGSRLRMPKFDIRLPELKAPKIDLSAAKTELEISLPERKVEVHPPDDNVQDMPESDSKGVEEKSKPSSFSFPRFGFSKDTDLILPNVDVSLPEESASLEGNSSNIAVSRKFKLPSITLPKFVHKTSKAEIDFSAVDLQAKGPETTFTDAELKLSIKTPSIETKELNLEKLSEVDVSFPEGTVDLEGPKADRTSVSVSGKRDETKFVSPTKFKLPSVTIPKITAKAPKENVEIPPEVGHITGPEISLQNSEIGLSAEPMSADMKMPEFNKLEKSLSVDMKAKTGLPEVKGPKIDSTAATTEIAVSLPEGKMEVHPLEVELKGATEMKADLPKIDSKGLEVKTKQPIFSFPKFGFSKSDIKVAKADVILPNVDMKLQEGSIDLKGPKTDITVSVDESGQKHDSKFGSPTKFKLPSITLPKFATKASKGKEEDVHTTGPEISLTNAELELSAEPLSADVKIPDLDKKKKSLSVDMKAKDIQTEGQGSRFKLPKFGISIPEIKGPKIDSSATKTEIDISLLEAKIELNPPDVKLKEGKPEVKADIPEIDSQGLDVKTNGVSFPKFGYSKSEVKVPEADVSLPKVDVKLPEVSIGLEGRSTDITVSVDESGQNNKTKFELPSITLPKLATKAMKGEVDDVQITGPEISLPSTEIELSTEPLSADIKMPDFDEQEKPLSVNMKARDIEVEAQGSKFKLPKFGISLPEVKGPKIDSSAAKTEIDISLPEGKMEVHPPEVDIKKGTSEVKADISETDVKTKRPSFSFPKFGFSKSEVKVPEADVSLSKVDVKLPEGGADLNVHGPDIALFVGDSGQKGERLGSPTKFKLPSITLPKFAAKTSKMETEDVQITGPEIHLPSAETELSGEPLPGDTKVPDMNKEEKSLSVDITARDILIEGQSSKIKLPKFGISHAEVKGPTVDSSTAKTEIDIYIPEGKMEMHPPEVEPKDGTAEVNADIPDIDSKGFDVKIKHPSFSFPKFGFSKSEVIVPEADVSLSNVNAKLPERSADLHVQGPEIAISVGDSALKDETTFGSPTKFKLPSIMLPKFSSKAPKGEIEDVQITGPEMSLPSAELESSTEPLSAVLKMPEDIEQTSPNLDIIAKDVQIEEQESKFKVPKFGISLPEVKGPKIESSAAISEIGISLLEGKMEVHPPEVELKEQTTEVNADIPEIDVKAKGPSFTFPKFGFSKLETKVPETDVSHSKDDVKLPEGSVDFEGQSAKITVIPGDSGQKNKSKFGSPTKFKLPSITLPKFASKAPKGEVENVEILGPEISLPNADLELSAEPLSAGVNMPDIDKEGKSLSVDIKEMDIQTKGQEKKFKLPTFGISLPEVKGPVIDLNAAKTEIDISVPEEKMEVPPCDVELKGEATEVKANIPDMDSKGPDVKTKRPSFSFPKFGFSKSEVKVPEADINLPKVEVKLPERSVDLEGPNTDITVSIGDSGPKDKTKFGSPTKFKLPSITLPKFGVKVEGAQITEPEISVPNAELELSAEPLSANVKMQDFEKHKKSLTERQGSKFKLPKFEISLPEVKGPKIESNTPKTETEISLPEGKMEVHLPEIKLKDGTTDMKADLPKIDSKDLDVKSKRSGFSFPKFGFSKSEMKVPEADVNFPKVDSQLPEESVGLEGPNIDITVSGDDSGKQDKAKFGSPTKFKLPSISLPKFATKAPKPEVDDVQTTGKEISTPNVELELSTEPLSADVKMPEFDKQEKSLNEDTKTEGQGSKFKLPTFGISLPEVKGPKIDSSTIDTSLFEEKMEVHPPEAELKKGREVKAEIPETDFHGVDVKTKGPSFSFPKFGFSKSEAKVPEAEVSLPTPDAKLPKESIDLDVPDPDIRVPVGDSGQKDETKFGSPTKFKLPSITLPKFTIKASKGEVEEVYTSGTEASLTNAEIELPAEPLSADIKMAEFDKQEKPLSVDMKAKDIEVEAQGSKFKLPKFGISLPEVKGPKIDSSAPKTEIDISLPEGKMEVHPPELKLKEGTTEVKQDIPDMDSKDLDVKPKRPSFSFPKFGFSKSEVKVPEADVSLSKVEAKLQERSADLEGPNTDITVSIGDPGQKDWTKFGSPTKFKLPSITLPTFGAKAPKEEVEDVQITGTPISLPSAELELSTEQLSAGVKMPGLDKEEKALSVDMKAKDIQIEGQGSTFKLPKCGIGLPEVRGPTGDSAAKTEIGISLPEGKMEVHPPELKLKEGTTEVKQDIPDMDSKDLDVKPKRPSFSFPKFGFSKSEVKVPETDVSLSTPNVKLPTESIDLDVPSTNITVSIGDSGQKDETKFGSPTKFKLPSITLPKFAAKASKGEAENAQITGPEISLPGAELELSAEIKTPELDKQEKFLSVDTKQKDIQIEGQGSKFKLPKFGISIPEVKGPKIDSGAAKTDISLSEGKMDVSLAEGKLNEGTAKVKAEIPEIDSKGFDGKTKQPSFSFPKFGFFQSEKKFPEADENPPLADMKLPEGSVDLTVQRTDVTVSMADSGQKDETKFGSPTKFKLPSITFPKFGAKVPKGDIEDVHIMGPENSVPNAELELSAELLSADVKVAELDKQDKSLSVDMKAKDIQIEQQESKFRLPKFGISLPEIKGPKIDSSAAKTEIDISLPDGKMKVPDVERKEGKTEVKADIPEIDSRGLGVRTKGPSFSFPKFGFSKSQAKDPEADASLPKVDVKLPEGSVDLQGPNTAVSLGDSGEKGKTKFGSPTKFKLPSITLPKFGAKVPKGEVEHLQITGPDKSVANAELELSAEPLSTDIKMPEFDRQKTISVDMKANDIPIEEQGTKFKLPTFGISPSEVKGPKSASKTEIDMSLPSKGSVDTSAVEIQFKGPEISLPDADLKLSSRPLSAEIKGSDAAQQETAVPTDMKVKGIQIEGQGSKFKLPKFGISLPEVKGPKIDSSMSRPQIDIALPDRKMEVHSSEVEQPEKAFKVKGSIDVSTVEVPDKVSGLSLADAELKIPGGTLSTDVKGPDVSNEQKSFLVDMKSQDMSSEWQGRKFKLPKFGISLPEKKGTKTDVIAAKTEGKGEKAEIPLPGKDITDSTAKLNISGKDIKFHDLQDEVEVKDTIQGPTEASLKMEEGDKGSPSRFKLPTIKMSKIGMSKTKYQDGDSDANMSVNVPQVALDPKHKKEAHGHEKSSKFTMPTLGDVLRGFDVEFNVPRLDEIEGAKTEISTPVKLESEKEVRDGVLSEAASKYKEGGAQETTLTFKLPKLGINLPSNEGDKKADSETSLENNEKQMVAQTENKSVSEDKQIKSDKSGWFRFPKFSSPTKTAKTSEKESSQPPQTEESPVSDNKEKEAEQSSSRGIEEDSVSPTLSLRSSDAFADVSSALTTEHICLSLASPTKVKVKYSESAATVEISDLHGDVITSTARTELISMEPHQPEKVNIPCSSDMSSSSVDTLREMSGEIHKIVSNIQPDTQHAAIFTNLNAKDIESLALQNVSVQPASLLPVDNTRVQKEQHTLVERYIVTEGVGGDKEDVFVTKKTQIFEGYSAESVSGDTASSIRKLKDTVHTEKMRFFESEESNKQNVESGETALRHIDSSAEENEGK